MTAIQIVMIFCGKLLLIFKRVSGGTIVDNYAHQAELGMMNIAEGIGYSIWNTGANSVSKMVANSELKQIFSDPNTRATIESGVFEAAFALHHVLTILEEYMKQTGSKRKIESTPTEFYKDLKLFAIEECGVDGLNFPRSSAVLTRRMNENKSNLEDIGIYFDTPRGKNRCIRIWKQ